MSQHDFSIANQTASSARTDINNALQALASLSSGSTAPSTTYANQLWYDTGNDQIKLRNEANSDWITLGTVDTSNERFAPSGGIPAGAVQAFAMNTAPVGWLDCDGRTVSRTTYSNLFSAIGTTFGSGDGSTTFNLPDLRGEFIRGWDDGRGIDSGRSFGSAQADEFKLHGHPYRRVNEDAVASNDDGGAIMLDENAIHASEDAHTGAPANAPDKAIGGSGGDETRPRNIALLHCIKT